MLTISYNEESITSDICKIMDLIEVPLGGSVDILVEDYHELSDACARYREGKIYNG